MGSNTAKPKKSVLVDSLVNIFHLSVNEVIDPYLNIFKCFVNYNPYICHIYETELVNQLMINQYETIYSANPSLFCPFKLYSNGRYTYIIYLNALTNASSHIISKNTIKDKELKQIASTLLNGVKLLIFKGIKHALINWGNIFKDKDGQWKLGVGNLNKDNINRLVYSEMISQFSPAWCLKEYYMVPTHLWMIGFTLYQIITGGTPIAVDIKNYFTTAYDIVPILQSIDALNGLKQFMISLMASSTIIDEALSHPWIIDSKSNLQTYPKSISMRNDIIAINSLVMAIKENTFEYNSLFKNGWELEDEVLRSMLSISQNASKGNLKDIKYSVISVLKLMKEESLWAEFCNYSAMPVSSEDKIISSANEYKFSPGSVHENLITEYMTFSEFICARQSSI